jgi:hypothetical protein
MGYRRAKGAAGAADSQDVLFGTARLAQAVQDCGLCQHLSASRLLPPLRS